MGTFSKSLEVVQPPPSPQDAVEGPSAGCGKDTFCTYPWLWLYITPAGLPLPCGKFLDTLQKDGAPLTIYEHSLEEIWNSEAMRALRRRMMAGEEIPGCAVCYRDEVRYGLSFRTRLRDAWNAGWLNEQRRTEDDLRAEALANDGRLATRPLGLHLDFGNPCNLKCRMCNGYYSSRINRDLVHRRWAGMPDEEEATRLPGPRHWFGRKDILFGKLLKDPGHLRVVYLAGGEPFISREVGQFVEGLLVSGAAPRVRIEFTTNGSTVTPSWLPRLAAFESTDIFVSIDGYGPAYDYVRHPARWEHLLRNLEHLRRLLPAANFWATVTVMNYNVLDLVKLYRFFDAIKLRFMSFRLDEPLYLRPEILPPTVRRLAAYRLRLYADQEAREEDRDWLTGIADGLEPEDETGDAALLREFMLFTNDLDQSRGQSFREVHTELFEMLGESGFAWTDETCYASPEELAKGRVSLL